MMNLGGNYDGKLIRLTGYIKTEKVKDGFAGLWMRIDPQVAFDNMQSQGIKGTTDWKKYEITLPLNPQKTDSIVFGALLAGSGKAWIDNLEITIDDKALDNDDLKTVTKKQFPAELDKEFDNGSGITFPKLDDAGLTNLDLLGRVWGFMKYYHPEVAKGNYNWDYELFRILPDYLNVKDGKERDRLLLKWLAKYGKPDPCKTCKQIAKNAALKPDLAWIDSSGLSETLQTTLKNIYENRGQGEHYYIGLAQVGNPDFKNEKLYNNMPYPDAGFRLLTLYKYWNMVQYFAPDKNLTDKKWDTILRQYIHEFVNARNELEYELAALKVIGELHDSHANLWGGGDKIAELRGQNFAPFRAEFIEGKYVVVDYFNPELMDTTEIKIGDVITQISGKSVERIVDSLRIYYPSSNDAAMLRDIAEDLLRSPDSTLGIHLGTEKKNKAKRIKLYNRDKLNFYRWYRVNENEKSYRMLAGNIGYITLANIKEEDIAPIKKEFKNTRGIIIDIRNYPSTFVPFLLGSYFMKKSTPFVKFTKGNPDNAGEFTFTATLRIPPDGNSYAGKLVVLVNEKSQSQAEYTAMAFKAVKDAKIVGSTTAGADGNVSSINLPGGLRSWISGLGVLYPDGTDTQRIGIVPDVVVLPTIDGIKNRRDEVLEKAIEIINK